MKTEGIKKLSETLREAADNAERLAKAMGAMGGPAKMQICGDLALIEVADVRKAMVKDFPVATPEDFDRSYNSPSFFSGDPGIDHFKNVDEAAIALNYALFVARAAGGDVNVYSDLRRVSVQIRDHGARK